jgi:hypothetical protein
MEVVVVGATVEDELVGAVVVGPVDAAVVEVDFAPTFLPPPQALSTKPAVATASNKVPDLLANRLRLRLSRT